MGMTKGKVATYGVVMQILQQNLGGLKHPGRSIGTSQAVLGTFLTLLKGILLSGFLSGNLAMKACHLMDMCKSHP